MDILTAIRQPVAHEMDCYKRYFDQALSHEDDFLGVALAYIRQRRGKMMRPLLVALVAREFGELTEKTYRAAITVELLHTASLVHDDVVDESGERRGQASVNGMYGNKMAVLLGDYLLSQSLHQSALTGSLECVDVIAQLGGTLSEGEIAQLANIRNGVANEQAYYDVIRRKTAELFAACGRLGAVTQGAPAEAVEAAADFGMQVGMCFQIRDDIFDYFPASHIGKPTGNDMAEGKLTLPALHALAVNDDALQHDVARRIQQGEATTNEIHAFVEWVKAQGGIDYARQVMENFRTKALRSLDAFTNDDIRRALTLYMDYVIGRDM
ncbi:MAG: polyprenyl synthetase family protein [Bacteroidales bacterium]|nr:polyprenyl synthetase family protein [Bacteroidales bacterium]